LFSILVDDNNVAKDKDVLDGIHLQVFYQCAWSPLWMPTI
jgi:hypothetical protein